MKLELEGKTALVTGALGGIGRAAALSLSNAGVKIVAAAREAGPLAELAGEIARAGGSATTLPGDLTDPGYRASLAATEPDVLVHAAGHKFRYAKLHTADPADRASLFSVDVEAFLALAELVAPSMMQRRFGRFIAISSAAAQLGGAGSVPYVAAKSALEGAVRGLAVDYGRYNVTANAIAPGFTSTARFESRVGEGGAAKLEGLTSTKRITTPEEIADAILFLASPRTRSITGTTMLVDGGLHLGNSW